MPGLIVIACSATPGPSEDHGTTGQSLVTGTGQCRGVQITDEWDGYVNPTSEPAVTPANPIQVYVPRFARLTHLGAPAVLGSLRAALTFDSPAGAHYACYYNNTNPADPLALVINQIQFVDATRDPGYQSCSSFAGSQLPWGSSVLGTMSHVALTARYDGTVSPVPQVSFGVSIDVGPLEDGNPCSINRCDPAVGPVSSPSPTGAACSDGQLCNGVETCNASGACVAGANLTEGVSCSDGNFCNGEETCNGAGGCAGGAAPPSSAFDDHNPCTADSCSNATGGIINALIPACTGDPGATALDSTTAAALGDSTEFLYTGSSPVQTGVAPGTIDKSRASVVRGRVLLADGFTPAVGITVSLLGHPELGQTLTRAGGWYDLAVNGGAVYNVDINHPAYLRVQRQARTIALGYSMVDDVVLTTPYVSNDSFTPGAAVRQVVHGAPSVGVDSDPTRSALLYFPPNTNITSVAPDGQPRAVQVTEFTVANGPRRMPGDLPGTSGYTYAVELGIPSAGTEDVHFDRDVVLYVNNFTGYAVGKDVPLGYYDRAKGAWLAEKSGRIIKVLAVNGGVPSIDITGDGVAESNAALDTFGLGADERAMLGAEYAANTSLWRCAVPHFSAWDLNWPFGPPVGAAFPPDSDPRDDTPEDPCERAGSIIGCESRTLGEAIPLAGTPFSLHYQSERAQGFRSRFKIKLTDSTVLPATLRRAHIVIEVAGRTYHYEREAPVPANQSLTWTWDGKDAYGRVIEQGTVDARIRVGFEFGGAMTFSAQVFGAAASGGAIDGDRTARSIFLWKESHFELRRSEAKPLGFGGWTLDANHLLDRQNTIDFGNGRSRKVAMGGVLPLGYMVDTAAGGGASYNDNGSALQAYLGTISDIATGPDGSLYVAQDAGGGSGRIRRITPDGIITTIAGLLPVVARSGSSDGSAALNAQVFPTSLAVTPDGSVIFAELANNQVWKIDSGGAPAVRLVAGTGAGAANDCTTDCGDGKAAKTALVLAPTSIAADRDGTIFVADSGHKRVRRIGRRASSRPTSATRSGPVRSRCVRMERSSCVNPGTPWCGSNRPESRGPRRTLPAFPPTS